MNQVILASHGNLSVGALDTVHMIVGEIPNVHALTLQREDKESISGKIVELIKTFDKNDHVYVLTDMLGSSVNNSAVELLTAAGKYCCYCWNEHASYFVSCT